MLQHEWRDVPIKYPPTTLPFQLEKKFYVVSDKSQAVTREGQSKQYVYGANEVKNLILGFVCNAISSVSMQQE